MISGCSLPVMFSCPAWIYRINVQACIYSNYGHSKSKLWSWSVTLSTKQCHHYTVEILHSNSCAVIGLIPPKTCNTELYACIEQSAIIRSSYILFTVQPAHCVL